MRRVNFNLCFIHIPGMIMNVMIAPTTRRWVNVPVNDFKLPRSLGIKSWIGRTYLILRINLVFQCKSAASIFSIILR